MAKNALKLSHPLDPPGLQRGGGATKSPQNGLDDVNFYSINGAGNNLANPTQGAAGTEEVRLAPPHVVSDITPNPRVTSNTVFTAPKTDDAAGRSAYFYAFGQFVDHDIDLNVAGVGTLSITVPQDDPALTPGSKITITKGQIGPSTGNAVNSVTQYLDLSQVYGSDTATAAALRNPDGTMKTSAGGNLPIVDGSMVGGDIRAIENPELTAIDILFVREHNYWVGRLHVDNPKMTADDLYNAARAITTAEYQHIVYTEFVPSIVGGAMTPYTGYKPGVSTQISEEFATAAYRFGHAAVSGHQSAMGNDGAITTTKSLAEVFFEPAAAFVANGGADGLLRDMAADRSQAISPTMIPELRNLLNAGDDQGDLAAIDIMREADLGLGTLNQTRTALGLPAYTSFDQITTNATLAAQLQGLYGTPDTLDLFVGGLAENQAAGAAVGPTFQAIIAKQFEALRDGDRMFYLNQHFGSKFTAEINATTLSDLIMRDSDTAIVQTDAFRATVRHASDVASSDPTQPQLVIGIAAAGAAVAGSPGVDNTIVAGLGLHQILSGGGSADRFVFLGGGHNDTISNFNIKTDVLDFEQAATPTSPGKSGKLVFNEKMSTDDFRDVKIKPSGTGSLVTFDDNQVLLQGVAPAQLSASNFLFNQNNAVLETNPHHT